MRSFALWAVILIPAILSVSTPARAAPLETYGRLPSLEDIADLSNTLLACMGIGEVKLRHLRS